MNTGKLDLLAEQAEAHASQASPLLTPVITNAEDPSPEASAKLNSKVHSDIQALMIASLSSLPEPTLPSNSTTTATAASNITPSTTVTSQLCPTESIPSKKAPTTTTTANANASSSSDDDESNNIPHNANDNNDDNNIAIPNDDDNDDVETILGSSPHKRSSLSLVSCGRDLLHLLESVKHIDLADSAFDSTLSRYHAVLEGVQKRLDELEGAHFFDPRELLAMERLRVLALKISEHLRIARLERAQRSSGRSGAGGLGEDGAPVGVVITAYPDSAVLKQTTKYKNKPLRFVLKVLHAQGRRFEYVGAEARHELVLCSQPQVHGGLSRSSSGIMQGNEGISTVAAATTTVQEAVLSQDSEVDQSMGLQSPSLKRRKTEIIDESSFKDIGKYI